MPILPVRYPFNGGRPCVQFRADGLPANELLTCLVDFGTTGHVLLLYWHAIQRVRIAGYGANNDIILIDGSSYNVQAVYLAVDWWNVSAYVRTNILHAVRYGRNVDGHVGVDFFPIRTLTLNFSRPGELSVS